MQLDRRRVDDDVFEHVIWGVRVNQVLQMLRDLESRLIEQRRLEASTTALKRPSLIRG